VHFGGMSVNGNSNFRRAYEPLLPGVFHIDSPWLYRNAYTQDEAELGRIVAAQLEREIVFQGADTVAAFIAEPIQGAGGVIVPPANFWPLVREACDRHGVLLIADEVVTGFGRGGAMFGTRLWDVKADLWCLAKGISSGYIPLGATAISTKVAEVFDSDATANSGLGQVSHGYTSSAHPVAAAAALATLRILQSDDVPGHVARVAPAFQQRLRALEQRSPFVGNVRGKGLMLGIEMVADKAQKTPLPKGSDIPARVAKAAYRRGLMVRVSGGNLILSPPLVISEAELDHLCSTLEAAFDEVAAAS
jgi:adenosylmethionine-8-amino-7-oxononanoate aminotransferase